MTNRLSSLIRTAIDTTTITAPRPLTTKRRRLTASLVAALALHLTAGSASAQAGVICGGFGDPGYTWTGDFNGDGAADVASARADAVHMYMSTSQDFAYAKWDLSHANWGDPGYTWAADFNNDGKTDIASAIGDNAGRSSSRPPVRPGVRTRITW